MNYKDANKIEEIIKNCCDDAAELVGDEVDKYLDGRWISAADWTIICADIQSGLAAASARAIRILAASGNLNLITNKETQ
jgi:hypothetical protein